MDSTRLEWRRLLRWAAGIALLGAILVLQWEHVAPLAGPARTVALQAVVTGLMLGGVYGLVAMGLTLVFGVLEIINFAHGALMTVGMYVAFTIVTNASLDPYLTLVVTVPALFVLGAAVQRIVINPAMGQPLENQLLLTLGLAILIENVLLLQFTATPRTISLPYASALGFPIRLAGAVVQLPRLIAFIGAIVMAAILFVFLNRTKTGTAIRAVGQNSRGASLVGINVRRIYVLTFGFGTAAVGAAGALALPFLPLEPTTGGQFNILAFVIVVLGSLGNIAGALVGGIIIGLTQQLGGLVFPGQSNLLPVFIIFVLTLFLRPEGLFGGRA